MKFHSSPPIDPLWPYGTLAYFYVKNGTEGRDIGVRELRVREVEHLATGWRITAEVREDMLDIKDREFVFEVDENGESPVCVPWDDELEQQYNLWNGTFTEEPGTVPVRIGGPTLDPDTDLWEIFDAEHRDQSPVAKAGTREEGETR